MSKFFYSRLAINNIKKNSKTYFPYLFTYIGTIMMFYNMSFLAVAKDIGSLSDSQSLRQLLFFGEAVIAIFSVIFLFYTNSFLIKRRKKEFGLFNILGMEKKHIARVMTVETLMIALISLVVGLLAGILLSKLMILLLFKIISFHVSFGFEIPFFAVISTVLLFSGISILNLTYNIFQVYRSKPIQLLKGGNVGEREPKTKWILASVGLLSLGIGYHIALTTETPLAALNRFFLAVLLVIIGTYALFTAGSVAVLKMLRRNKRFYYKANHFISVSGMIYRMKQNAVGLANIAILSTMVIVTLSTTISLYVGVEDVLRTRYPRDVIVDAANVSEEQIHKIDAVIERELAASKMTQKNGFRYRSMEWMTIQDGNHFTAAQKSDFSRSQLAFLLLIPLEDYNRMEKRSVSLSSGEALLYPLRGKIEGDTISFNDFQLSIKERLSSLNTRGELSGMLINSYLVVVDSVDTILRINRSLEGNESAMKNLSYHYGFDVNGDRDQKINLINTLRSEMKKITENYNVDGIESSRDSFFTLYGGLFFLGIFLGLLFIMATVLIIYYKQIAEGYEDRERFEIMQKVGMSRAEVKRAIRTQVLAVFFLPLVTAVIHLAFAFKVITKLLNVFNLTNIPLFAFCTAITILVFAGFYVFVYILTARTYYKIVSFVSG